MTHTVSTSFDPCCCACTNVGKSAADTIARAAVAQHERVVGRRQQRVDGNGHDSRVDRAEERDRPVDGVVREQQHALLASQTRFAQHVREACDARCKLAVRQRVAVVDVRRLRRTSRIERGQVRGEIEL